MDITPKVSIIIPVYKVEQSIERCARSLFEQTFKDIEYIFVDDCSPDNSVQLLKKVILEYPEIKKQVTILYHETNKGVSFARNTGLDNASGEYVIQVDSDDWVEKSMIEELYTKAIENNSDIVWCDFYVDFPNDLNNPIYRKQDTDEKPGSCIIKILSGTLHAGLWNKLLKRTIIISNNIKFPEGVNMCEDMVFTIQYLICVDKVTYLNRAFYHYVQMPNSITISRTRQSFESEIKAVRVLEENLTEEVYHGYLNSYKARIKRNLFFSGLYSYYEYYNCFPESLHYIYKGINLLDKTAIWFSLKKHFLLAQIFLFLGRIYTSMKVNLIKKSTNVDKIG